MAAVVTLAGSAKGWGKLSFIFSAVGKTSSRASGAVMSWRRHCSSHSEQTSSKPDMLLSQFISPYTGHILGMHVTGLCPKKQKAISKAIKKAHCLGFMPGTYKDQAFLSDPKICNIRYPE
ncbi:small ribosomal subunit protein bS18m isoform X2 [Paroedura picta]|uniref:small ribosomal subunit protein bS18m isoform X2 n=1 Tax=Paroedura picta TaxID=143630 RepID=UPI0040561B1F